MPITLNGSGTVTGISAGGLPDGCITAAELATGVGGKVLQYKVAKKTDGASVTDSSATGVEISSDFRITLTPTSATSIIYCMLSVSATTDSTATTNFKIYRNTASDFSGTSTKVMTPSTGTANVDGNMNHYNGNGGGMAGLIVTAFETSGNTTARTYSPFWSVQSSTAYMNKWSSASYYSTSTFTVMEIPA